MREWHKRQRGSVDEASWIVVAGRTACLRSSSAGRRGHAARVGRRGSARAECGGCAECNPVVRVQHRAWIGTHRRRIVEHRDGVAGRGAHGQRAVSPGRGHPVHDCIDCQDVSTRSPHGRVEAARVRYLAVPRRSGRVGERDWCRLADAHGRGVRTCRRHNGFRVLDGGSDGRRGTHRDRRRRDPAPVGAPRVRAGPRAGFGVVRDADDRAGIVDRSVPRRLPPDVVRSVDLPARRARYGDRDRGGLAGPRNHRRRRDRACASLRVDGFGHDEHVDNPVLDESHGRRLRRCADPPRGGIICADDADLGDPRR